VPPNARASNQYFTSLEQRLESIERSLWDFRQMSQPHLENIERSVLFSMSQFQNLTGQIQYASGQIRNVKGQIQNIAPDLTALVNRDDDRLSADMKYDVGIAGFWYSRNYGSMLTYYALHQVLADFGLSACMLEKPWVHDDDPDYSPNHARSFAERHFHIGPRKMLQEMHQLNGFFGAFVAGPDQVWNHMLSSPLGFYHFLDFADSISRKIAVASSFGHYRYYGSDEDRQIAAGYLRRFDALSVENEAAKRLCVEQFGIFSEKVTVMLDPVFLCDGAHYEALMAEAEQRASGDYIAAYFVGVTDEKRGIAAALAEALSARQVELIDGACRFGNYASFLHAERDVTAQDFLAYLHDSACVITDDFYGVCFAILFNKPFLAFGDRLGNDARVPGVLELFGLGGRAIYSDQQEDWAARMGAAIDYAAVNGIAQRERAAALRWLRAALSGN
jgi:hypothetical protein